MEAHQAPPTLGFSRQEYWYRWLRRIELCSQIKWIHLDHVLLLEEMSYLRFLPYLLLQGLMTL